MLLDETDSYDKSDRRPAPSRHEFAGIYATNFCTSPASLYHPYFSSGPSLALDEPDIRKLVNRYSISKIQSPASQAEIVAPGTYIHISNAYI